MKTNKIKNIIDIKLDKDGQHPFEVTIKDKKTGKIIYQNESKACFLGTMENGEITPKSTQGVHQIFGCGNVLFHVHLIEMMKNYLRKDVDEIVDKMIEARVIKGDPEKIREIIKERL